MNQITNEDTDREIKNIFNENKIYDLKKFLSKRQCLNNSNQCLNYFFHIIQSVGILTTTIATGYDMKEIIWIGIGMNILATLINIFEKTNDSISKRLLKEIYSIKNGTYVDEGMFIEESIHTESIKINNEKQNKRNEESDMIENEIIRQMANLKNENV
jgi:hypothetical protein